jgi:hypothetical protein
MELLPWLSQTRKREAVSATQSLSLVTLSIIDEAKGGGCTYCYDLWAMVFANVPWESLRVDF